MIALFVNNVPSLIGTMSEVDSRIQIVKKSDPHADIHKQDTCKCGACGSHYFDELEALTCSCHDNY